MKKILWISPYAPYDTVGHAGGKNQNYYLKNIFSRKKFDIKLLSMCNPDEIEKMDLDNYKIENDIFCVPDNGIYKFIRKIVNVESVINPFNKHHNMPSNFRIICFTKLIKRNISDVASADMIILHWTQSLLMYPIIRKYAKEGVRFIAIEEDVSYLGYQRKYVQSKTMLSRVYWKLQYKGIRKREIALLKECDLVVTTNRKDSELLQKSGIPSDMLYSMNLYYDNYFRIKRDNIEKCMLLYYGAMNRKENYSAVIWFVREVMPLLDEKFQLVVVGSNPHKDILKLKSERVIIKGFIEDVGKYFSQCLCLVVPLLLGAGIKVKILEAMSAGVPVLTNEIGIEGIYANDGVHYLHCTTKEEYAMKIQLLSENKINGYDLGLQAQAFIHKNFDIQKSADELVNYIENM